MVVVGSGAKSPNTNWPVPSVRGPKPRADYPQPGPDGNRRRTIHKKGTSNEMNTRRDFWFSGRFGPPADDPLKRCALALWGLTARSRAIGHLLVAGVCREHQNTSWPTQLHGCRAPQHRPVTGTPHPQLNTDTELKRPRKLTKTRTKPPTTPHERCRNDNHAPRRPSRHD